MATDKKKTDSFEESPRLSTTPQALWMKPTPEALRAMGHEGRRYFVGALLAQSGVTVKDPRTLDRGMRGEPVRERDEILDAMARLDMPLPAPEPLPPPKAPALSGPEEFIASAIAAGFTPEEVHAFAVDLRIVPEPNQTRLMQLKNGSGVKCTKVVPSGTSAYGRAPQVDVIHFAPAPPPPPPTGEQIRQCSARGTHWTSGARPANAQMTKIACIGCGEIKDVPKPLPMGPVKPAGVRPATSKPAGSK